MRAMLRVEVSSDEEKALVKAWLDDGMITVTLASGDELTLPLTYVRAL